RNAPDLPRPFFVRGFCVLGPVSFIISALIVYWSGWNTVSWLLGLQILMFVVYILFKNKVPTHAVSLKQQIWSSLWLIAFYALIIVASYLGSFGGINAIGHPWDTITVAVIALAIYYWGAYTCLPQANFAGDEEE
ncbi:aspartate:proton symporter, partial [Serratia proteamaculans]|nr:aspartate:proton symporter [Serratia proteamaculans]